jgi:hypothetical protein
MDEQDDIDDNVEGGDVFSPLRLGSSGLGKLRSWSTGQEAPQVSERLTDGYKLVASADAPAM